jgi:hypothetical protein
MKNLLHIRFNGESFDVALETLDLGLASSEREVKQRVASHLEVDASRLRDYVVDRHANGNLTLRPEAVFG